MSTSALVLVIDGLGARYLGPYGNTWIETPAFNRLAAESLVVEQAYADSPALPTIYCSLLCGRHAACPVDGHRWLPEQLSELGIATTLLTDDAELAEHPGARHFAERIVADEPLPVAAAHSEDEIAHTGFARLFALAIERLERAREPFLLWVHSRGMTAPWDAPLSFREQFLSEDDPPVYGEIAPPTGFAEMGYDPEELLPYSYAYAGQIALLDACLDPFLDVIQEIAARKPLLQIVTSPRGYPLGEHKAIGYEPAGLYEELLHTPLFVRWPDGIGACLRSQALVQPADIHATLLDAFSPTPRGASPTDGANLLPLVADERAPWRKHALSISPEGCEQTLRTKHWTLVRRAEPVANGLRAETIANGLRAEPVANGLRAVRGEPTTNSPPSLADELYLKPDDRCEANEIASRLPQTVSDLSALLEETLGAARENRPLDEANVPASVWDEPNV